MRKIASKLLVLCSISAYQVELGAVACVEFDQALTKSLNELSTPKVSGVVSDEARREILSHKSIQSFKKNAPEFQLSGGANRKFIDLMEKEKKGEALYFDVENSLQKKMNDQVFQDKGLVDAINNHYIKKVHEMVSADPYLKARLAGEYKDYKGLRLRFVPKSVAEKNELAAKLQNVYKKANQSFADDISSTEMKKLIATRSDEAQDPSLWFLGGVGDNALHANMAARYARQSRKMGEGAFVNYANEAKAISRDMVEIENVRGKLSSLNHLKKYQMMTSLENGELILSKETIGILRKSKPGDFKNPEEYFSHLEKKFQKIFGVKPNREELSLMSEYFNKVDALSPPLFQRERVIIDLEKAEHGLVSVDFTGVGVDNAFEQMRGLAQANYREKDPLKLASSAFSSMDKQVQTVTEEMNQSKRFFAQKVKEIRGDKAQPQFSGDDGMFMPNVSTFSLDEKKALVEKLSTASDPSKFRLTFVRSTDETGAALKAKERSERVVRAEKLEKEIREDIIGASGISAEAAKKIMIAIDYAPRKVGGDFKLIVSPKPSAETLQLISQSFHKRIQKSQNENALEILTLP